MFKFFALLSFCGFSLCSFAQENNTRGKVEPISASGTAEVSIAESGSFIEIQGLAAEIMYGALKVEEVQGGGEAGSSYLFKEGYHYRCFKYEAYFACQIRSFNPATGTVNLPR